MNDSKATNIDATIKALELFKNREIFLILGGDDKGVDLNELFEELKKYNVTIFSIGKNAFKIEKLSEDYGLNCNRVDFLENALEEIDKIHQKDTIALLSPAASSLDQFDSYVQRGEVFKNFVKSL